MSDLVERLREALFDPYGKEAADELNRLYAEKAELVEALEPFAYPPLYVLDKPGQFVPTAMPSDWIGGGHFHTDDFRRARAAIARAHAENKETS